MSERGLSPVVGTALLVALTVALASVVALVTVADVPAEPTPRAHFTGSADAGTDRIALTHGGGDALDPAALRVRISVDGDRLAYQPPVPFFAADGFESGPTGPFNNATRGPWTAGETAGLRLASTNAPLLDPGDPVTVEVYHGEAIVATVRTTAG